MQYELYFSVRLNFHSIGLIPYSVQGNPIPCLIFTLTSDLGGRERSSADPLAPFGNFVMLPGSFQGKDKTMSYLYLERIPEA
jgi:hypothetical protein